MTLKALIWDVDGTLAETEDIHRQAFNLAFARAGLTWTWDLELYIELLKVAGGRERILHFIDVHAPPPPVRESPKALAARLHGLKNAAYRELLAPTRPCAPGEKGWEINNAAILGLGSSGCLPARPGVARLAAEARRAGLRQAVCTTSSLENVRTLLHCLGEDLEECFDVLVTSEDATLKKPDPMAYLVALERLDLEPGQCLAIEDSRNGVLAATRAKVPVLAVPGLYTPGEDLSPALAVADGLGDLDAPCRVLRAPGFGPEESRTPRIVDLAMLRSWLARAGR